MAAKESVAGDSDYSLLKDLKIEIDAEERTFCLCFWIYLTSSISFPSTLIQQMHSVIKGDVPFLVLNEEKKMNLLPLLFLHEEAPCPGNSSLWTEVPCASAMSEFLLEKWIHVGCEVSKDFVRLHVDGVVVGEKSLSSSLKSNNPDDLKAVTLSGTSGGDVRLQGYVHNMEVLPASASVKDHYFKNPPLQLSIDNSSASEIEEGGDGVWSIVGGKASCRRNFSLDVVLLNAFGQTVNQEMEVVASLLYADNGAAVEKPNDAEAPLLTSYDGIEFASFDRPSKLLHGRASFKLKISQLSSKCDNRLFRIRFDIPKIGKYPFLVASSRPIRCISRNRSSRASSLPLKKSTSAIHPLDGPQLLCMDDGSPEIQHNNGHLPILTVRESKSVPPPKRVKVGQELSAAANNDVLEHTGNGCHSYGLIDNQGENVSQTSRGWKPGIIEGANSNTSDSESVEAKNSAFKKVTSMRTPISDLTIFKYCLGSTYDRSLLLKDIAISATDQEMVDFALQVSLYTGCSHHRYQIRIAKRLLEEGNNAWNLISQSDHHVLWENAIFEIEDQFMKISRCNTRCLTRQDFEVLHRTAGCWDYLARENFDKMWHWLYPIASTLSRDWINGMWASTSPKWIEGLITKEEAESSLSGPHGFQEPGTFILRFPTSRSWPHPDAGSLVVSYIDADYSVHHRLLSVDYSCSDHNGINGRPLQELLLEEPQLSRLGRVARSH